MKSAKRGAPKKQMPAAKLRKENTDLRARLAEAEETLSAIRSGEVDALVVSTARGDQVFALTSADRPYRVLIEEMTEGAATLNADGIVLYCNGAFANLLKKPTEQVIGSKMEDWIAPADRRLFQALLKSGETGTHRGELWLASSEGASLPVHLSLSHVQIDEASSVYSLIAVDLTEQKRTHAIVASEKLARSILENAAEAIVVCDEKQLIIRANEAAYDLCGDNPIGKLFDLAFPLRSIADQPLLLFAEPADAKRQGIEARLQRDGKIFDLLISIGPLQGKKNGTIGSVITLADITQRKAAEEQLAASKQQYAATLGSIGDAVLATDAAGKITFMNPVAEQLTGWKFAEAHQKPAGMVFNIVNEITHQAVSSPIDQVIARGVIVGLANHTLLVRRDGMLIPIDDSGAPINDAYGNVIGVVLVFRDISQRRRMEAEIETLSKFPTENPNPVLRINYNGVVLYANPASGNLLRHWNCSLGQLLPERTHKLALQAFKTRAVIEHEVTCGERIYSLVFAPVVDGGYVNIYGRDITERKKVQQQLQATMQQLQAHIDNTPMAIVAFDPEYRITEWSAGAERMFGWSAEEVLNKRLADLHWVHEDDVERVGALSADMFAGHKTRNMHSNRNYRKDGSVVDCEWYNSALLDANGNLVSVRSQALDVTERTQHELEVERLNRTRIAHTHSAQAMAHATDEIEYAQQVCKIIVEDCGHAMVWIGFAEHDEAKSVRPIASVGFEEGYLETLRITWADTERGRGPTGTAIRTGKPAACPNMLTDPQFAPWRAEALRRGYASSLVLPLMDEGKAFGALTIYFREPEVVSSEEVELLTRLADDLAFGIRTIRLRAARAEVEAALRQSEEKARNLIKYAPVGIFEIDFFGQRLISVNEVVLNWTGYTREELLAMNPLDLMRAEDRAQFQERIQKRVRGEPVTDGFEYTITTKDQREILVEVHVGDVKYQLGAPQTVLAVAYNITERKRIEAHIRQLSYAVESSPASIIITDTTGAIEYVNPKFCEVTGYTLEEVRGQNPRILQSGRTPPQVYEEMWRTIRSAMEWHGELLNKKKNGELYWELASIAPMIDAAGKITHYVAVKEDITKPKLMEMQVRAQARQLRAIADVSEQLSRVGLDTQSILDVVTERVCETVGNASFVSLLSADGHWLKPRSIYAPKLPAQVKTQFLSLPMSSQSDLVRQAVQGQAATFKSLSREQLTRVVTPEFQPILEPYIGADVVIAPLRAQARTLGIFGLVRLPDEQASFADEPSFLQDVADRAAIALVNAQLFDQVKRARAELEQRVMERTQSEHEQRVLAETMRDASIAFSRTLNLNTVFHELMTWLGNVVSFDSAAIMLIEENSTVRIHATVGYPTDADPIFNNNRFELSQLPVLRQIVETKTSRCLADVRQEPQWQSLSHTEHIVNWLGVPMVASDRVIGMFSIHKREPGYFSNDHVRLTEALASYAAAAIQNAQLYREVTQAREQLETLSRELMEAEEKERRALARELHDEIGQVLTAVKTNLEVHRLSSTSEAQDRSLEESVTIIDRALEQVRSLSLDLRPSLLDEFGLLPALEWFLDRQMQRHGFQVAFAANPPELSPSPKISTICFRVVQAALTNVVRHAQASHVTIRLDQCPSPSPAQDASDWIELLICDDGIGFDVQSATERALRGESMGLLGMQERVRLAGGQFKIQSTPGHGTEIRVQLPMEKEVG